MGRRAVVVGIVTGAPIITAVWLAQASQDPWVRWGYPVLSALLLAFGWVLVRRPHLVPRFATLAIALLEVWVLSVTAGRVIDAPSAAQAWISITPTPLLAAAIALIIGFVFQSTRVALWHGGAFLVLFTAVLAVLLGRQPDGGAFVWLALRAGVYLAIVEALLFVLSRAKERVAAAMARAARADAAASRMRDMAYLDELTGIANRRRLVEELSHQAANVSADHPACVVYFDLDHFKDVNDTLGHAIGDQALRIVADVATGLVRDDDLLARLGGEEFVLVAPDTDREKAIQLAERLRVALPDQLRDRIGRRITASFGVAELAAGEDPESVLRRVDALMYAAKAGGRDRVNSAELTAAEPPVEPSAAEPTPAEPSTAEPR